MVKEKLRHDKIRLGFFGSFYPSIDNLATTSNGYVKLLSEDSTIERVEVFCQRSGRLPDHWTRGRIELHPIWDPDSPLSLIRAIVALLRQRNELDIYFFNLHLTAFGRSRIANSIGLLIPSIIGKVTKKPTFTYMHNLLETQNLEELGYQPSRLARVVVRLIEKATGSFTHLTVPLQSQADAARGILGCPVQTFVLPFAEGIYALDEWLRTAQRERKQASSIPQTREVLLFGSWGPQKDLIGGLGLLSACVVPQTRVHVRVAGSANVHFPSYAKTLERLSSSQSSGGVEFLGFLPEEELASVFLDSDLVFLPYKATGGYSAAMNVAATFRRDLVAYDLPALREFASEIGADCDFIDPRAIQSSVNILSLHLSRPTIRGGNPSELLERREQAKTKVRFLVSRFQDALDRDRMDR
jgi:hypothetical protein